MAKGSLAFGYRHDEGEIVKDDEEQAVITTIVKMRQKGLSYNIVAATLNREGVLNRGKFWNGATLFNICRRENKGVQKGPKVKQ